MLMDDSKGVKVRTKAKSTFPKGTEGEIITCRFVMGTSVRAYCVQTEEDIKGLVKGKKTEWFLERELENVK